MNILCWLGFHKIGLMRIYRLNPSLVYAPRCYRCGKKEGQ